MNYNGFSGLAQALFEESADAQILTDANFERVLDANAAAQRLVGVALREVIAAPVSRLFRTRGSPGLPAAGPGRPRQFVIKRCELRTPDPDFWRTVQVAVTRLAVRPRPLVLLTVRDAAMVERRRVARRLRSLIGSAPSCLWRADVAGGQVRLSYVSPAVARIAGREPQYFGRDLSRWRDIVCPDDRQAWDAAWIRRGAGAVANVTYRLVLPDGTLRCVQDRIRSKAALAGGAIRIYGALAEELSVPGEDCLRQFDALNGPAEAADIGREVDGLILERRHGDLRVYGYVTEDDDGAHPRLRLVRFAGNAEMLKSLRQWTGGPGLAGGGPVPSAS